MTARANGRAVRVLVVDDVDYVAKSLVRLLGTMGCEARCTSDPQAALLLARQLEPEVALLDLAMPGMSGYEVAQQLRLEFPRNVLTLVALSASIDDDADARTMTAGFDAFVAKPVDRKRLEAIIRLQERAA